MKFLKLLFAFALVGSLALGAAAPSVKRSEIPTAEQVLPPFSSTLNNGYTLSNNGSKVFWTPPFTQQQSDWNATTGPTFIRNKPVIFDGDYLKLINKPVIPPAPIPSDWNQTDATKLDFIKNKPVFFDGDYNKLINKPTIPAPQVQSDWNQIDSTKPDFIKNKPAIGTPTSALLTRTVTAYTAVAADFGNTLAFNNADGTTLTIPAGLDIADGAEFEGVQLNTGAVTIVGGIGVTIVSLDDANKTSGKGSFFKIQKTGTNTFVLSGELYSTKATVPAGKNIILTAVGQGGTTPYTYQWKKNGTNISGATQVSLVLYSVTTADSGTYTCALTNTGGTLLSEGSIITVQ